MTRHSPAPQGAPLADAGERLAQLCDVLAIVASMAGRDRTGGLPMDKVAQVSAAYASAFPIIRRRFDRIAADTAAWAATGLEALTAGDSPPPRAAAEVLAEELDRALNRLAALLAVR